MVMSASARGNQGSASQPRCCREEFDERDAESVAHARTALLGREIVDFRVEGGERPYQAVLVVRVEGGLELVVTSAHGSSGMLPVFLIRPAS